jgi:mannose-1-phosphate guanylyltransferase/mannose-1-phosphate guanylyltransferase/mannose-6-phosphate isomerase
MTGRASDLRVAILAGGSGTRFWPLGRAGRPKQVLALDGDDPRTLLAATLDRVAPLSAQPTLVVAPAALARTLRGAAGAHDFEFVAEPAPRNTAAAVALAALLAGPEAVLLVVPADHHVAPLARYRAALRAMAERAAASEALVTLGLVPDHPATGYGWLRVGRRVAGTRDLPVLRVERFVEKPRAALARRLLADGRHRWNGGTFAFRVDVLRGVLGTLQPALLAALERALAVRGQAARRRALARAYAGLPSISFDHAVMERAPQVETVAADIAWDDLGSFDAVARRRRGDSSGNAARGDVTLLDAERCVVEAGAGHVALLGVKDLIVVQTKDALLILPRGAGERVREVVERLKAQGRTDLLS